MAFDILGEDKSSKEGRQPTTEISDRILKNITSYPAPQALNDLVLVWLSSFTSFFTLNLYALAAIVHFLYQNDFVGLCGITKIFLKIAI